MYITIDNMIERFSGTRLAKLTDHIAGAIIEPAVLNPAMEFASAKLDEAAAGIYRLPIPSLSQSGIGHLCDIAMYRLYDDQVQDDTPGERTSWRVRYEEAMDWIAQINSGDIPLLDDGGVVIPPVDEGAIGGVSVKARARVYTEELISKTDVNI